LITVRRGALAASASEAILRPVRADLAPLTAASRDVGLGAGAEVAARLERLGELPVGAAVITPAGELEASFIIHAVIASALEPVTKNSVERALLNGLRRVEEWGIASLSLPPVGVGAGQLELELAVRVMVDQLRACLARSERLSHVEIVVETDYQEGAFSTGIQAE
jgi:O-acetyl-ADP-ribose deacetylase (regulator of RNase III)